MTNQNRMQAYISIQHTDRTIMQYIKTVISPCVQDYNGDIITVPIVYNGAQRWVQIRKRNYLVDQSGNTLYPIISFSRVSTKRRQDKMVNKIWTAKRQNYIQLQNKYSKQRPFTTNDAKYGNIRKPSYINVMLPIPLQCSYEFQVYADNNQQMNQILQAFLIYDSKWWEIDGFRVKVKLGDFSNTTEIQTEQDRLIKSSFSIETHSIVFPKNYQSIAPISQQPGTKNIQLKT